MDNIDGHTNLKVIWENKLPLDNIKWKKDNLKEYRLPEQFIPKIKSNWKKHLVKNPTDYDGTLLFLNDFHFERGFLILNVGYIKFSTVIFMEKNKIRVGQGIGMLGTQCLVFSPCKQYILIGERPLTQTYYPGAITVPGGMLEIVDLDKAPRKALLREIYEEISLPLTFNAYLRAILVGWNGVSVTFLLSTSVVDSYDFDPLEIIQGEKDEWENNLRWIPLTRLEELPSNHLLDGLVYYQLNLKQM